MSTPYERAKDKAQRLASPAQHRPKVGQAVTYRHPAGDVQGTVQEVTARGLTLAVPRTGAWAGEPDAVLRFTLRPDGEYRLTGTGNSARPALVFQEPTHYLVGTPCDDWVEGCTDEGPLHDHGPACSSECTCRNS